MGKKVLVFLAPGFEEVEAVTPVDFLRRAGVEVVIAALGEDRSVTGSHGVALMADTTLGELETAAKLKAALWDGVFVPGGMPGSANLAACAPLGAFYQEMAAAGKITAAICAAPAVFLAPLGLLAGKRFTCYPGMEKGIQGGAWSADPVVADGRLITSRGPGTAAAFALALINALAGPEKAKEIAAGALVA
ncbi:MAG: DJ-1/PfpI family protein [Treponema sp.]|nr:DJ-1/PfpI family protein [Treponema sp.]